MTNCDQLFIGHVKMWLNHNHLQFTNEFLWEFIKAWCFHFSQVLVKFLPSKQAWLLLCEHLIELVWSIITSILGYGKYCSPAALVVVTAASPRATTSANHALESESDSDSESLYEVEGGSCERGTKSMETKRIRRYDGIKLKIKLCKFVMNSEQQAYIFCFLYIDPLLLSFQDGVQQGVCSTIQAEKAGTIIWTRVTGKAPGRQAPCETSN